MSRGYRGEFRRARDWPPSARSSPSPPSFWSRFLLLSRQIRICRLHRPFLTRGYTPGSRFAFSKDECIKSASFVINNQGAILDVAANLWMIYSHTLAAAIVLSADLFQCVQKTASPTSPS